MADVFLYKNALPVWKINFKQIIRSFVWVSGTSYVLYSSTYTYI